MCRKYSTRWLTTAFDLYIFNYMVESNAPLISPSGPQPSLDAVFHALGDATRRQMLSNLSSGSRTVGQLAEPFDMSLAAASKHIKVLEGAGLIRREINGRTHLCFLDAQPLLEASEWLHHYERFWTGRLDALEALLRQTPPADKTPAIPKGNRK